MRGWIRLDHAWSMLGLRRPVAASLAGGTVGRSGVRDRLSVRAVGRRLVLLLYNEAGAACDWVQVESVGVVGRTVVRRSIAPCAGMPGGMEVG